MSSGGELWLLAGVGFGAAAVLVILLYIMGGVARTIAWANVFNKRVALIPRDDRTLDVEIPNKIDGKGRWHMREKDKKIEIYTPDPRDVMLMGGTKVRCAHLIDNFSVTIRPIAAKLAECAAKAESGVYVLKKGDKIKVGKATLAILKRGRESISWPALKDRIKDLAGPSHMAGILGTSIKFHNPLPDEGRGISHNTKIILIVLLVIGIAAVGGYLLAKKQGWIG